MDASGLVIDDMENGVFRYHRSTLTSPEVMQEERDHIFEKCWLYLGHESEVEKPGDYVRRNVGGRPIFFARGKDGRMRAFYNTCTHRGAMICRQEHGNADVFQCFYHAWTFNNEGTLIGTPDEAGYSEFFDRAEMALKSPRMESYRGFMFVNFNQHAEDLLTYLAGAKEYMDLMIDQSESDMRVVAGSNKYVMKCNWKLLVENSMDGYHLIPTHNTYLEYLSGLGTQNGPNVRRWSKTVALGNGHSVLSSEAINGKPVATWAPLYGEDTKEEFAQKRQSLVDRFGEDKAWLIANATRNLHIYPNLIINDVAGTTVRSFWPVAPDHLEVSAWEVVPREEDGRALARRLDSFLTFLGPGGFATPDDVEALESCQEGFLADEVQWSDISRGMHEENPKGIHELQMRSFWRRWYADMTGQRRFDTGECPPARAHVEEPVLASDDD